MDIEYANTIPMRQILGKLGLHPAATSETQLLYLSPFHASNEPNFIVDISSNCWTDLVDNSTGTVIDFVCKHLKHYDESDTIVDAERWLKNIVGYSMLKVPSTAINHAQQDKTYAYVDHQHLQTPHLIHYLEQVRGIPFEVARFNLVEVNVHNLKTSNHFLAIGNKTEENTFCIRNEFCKAQLKRSYVSFIRGANTKMMGLHIFKDVFDYLTALTLRKGKPFDGDVIILNNYNNMPLSAAYIYGYGYKTVYTWLDNTLTGHEATALYRRYLKTQGVSSHTRMNKIYADHQSLNAWHVANKPHAMH